jgi:hypothetical protein
MGKGGGSAPPPPDYAGAAQQTAAGNLEAARAAAAANRVNQITPYGNLTYSQNQQSTFNSEAYKTAMDAYNQAMQTYNANQNQPDATDEYGNPVRRNGLWNRLGDNNVNPISGNYVAPVAPNYADFVTNPSPDSGWTVTTTLSPEQQKLLDIQNATSLQLGNLQQKGLGYVENMINKPFGTENLPQVGINAGENYSNAIMRRLAPQLAMEQKSFDQRMANQGIPVGSEAYANARRIFDMGQNDRLVSAQTGGIDVGLRANQQGFNQLGYMRNEPINTLNAIRSGSQVTNPTFQSVPQQATTSGADILGATQAGYNAQLGGYNAGQATNAANTSGMYQLGGTALMAGAMF